MSEFARHPFINTPGKLLGRIAMGALWGILLSPFEQDVKLAFGAVMAVLVMSTYPFFSSWDRTPRCLARTALHALGMFGEALGVGATVLATLAAFSGHLDGYAAALCICAFGGTVLPLYVRGAVFARIEQMLADRLSGKR